MYISTEKYTDISGLKYTIVIARKIVFYNRFVIKIKRKKRGI